jgi:tRNA A-37 threonylcarbamoyl transferase component Bud32
MSGESGTKSNAWTRWLLRAPLLLAKHLWVWPLLGALMLGVVGGWVRSRVEGATRAELGSRLRTLLNADVAALRLWFSEQESNAKSLATDVRFQAAIVDLAEREREPGTTAAELAASPPAQTLQIYLMPLLEAQGYLDYVVLSTDRRILAAPHPRMVGRPAPRGYALFMEKALAGQLAVSRPFARELTISQRAQGPTMFVAAPVKSTNGVIVAVLALRIRPEAEFTQIFSVARMGETGEAYAFDLRGMMLTATRFDEDLKKLGLIPNVPEATSILNLRLLDPGVDLERGEKPARPRRDLPLTRMAAAAVIGDDGADVQGYRNYRGVRVVGAWAWLGEFGMGVATEVAASEAFETLYLLRHAFLVLMVLLALSGLAIFGFTVLIEGLEATLRKNALTARRLGQYVLVQEIGRGANGMVYQARHALLRRPVAIKLLSPDITNETTAARFEHEVQMTSQLTHPNTVAVYDYGRTPEGLFYYAMEYLSGIDLDQLVRRFGSQPEGRVIHILRQVCGSLAEAHRIGLIHRDIKPANVVLTRRGGVCDLVKVVDFGLVTGRHVEAQRKTNVVVGTPHFMAPEAVETPEAVDARSDLYSLGAVGYWLLTGRTLFDSEKVEELLDWQVEKAPKRPSERAGRVLSQDLEEVLLRCLSKKPRERFETAEALGEALVQCAAAPNWTEVDAEKWWKEHVTGTEAAPVVSMAEKTLVIAPRN